jgi:hypothetical protein
MLNTSFQRVLVVNQCWKQILLRKYIPLFSVSGIIHYLISTQINKIDCSHVYARTYYAPDKKGRIGPLLRAVAGF